MKTKAVYSRGLMASAAVLALLAGGTAPAAAFEDAAQQASGLAELDDIVVTGSRIRRVNTETAAPIISVDSQTITDRGYISAGELLNEITSLTPMLNQADGSGEASGSGQQAPSLLGLGAGRTLTLVNGRRFVTTSSGLGDSMVDANIIPTGLIERVEVVQAGGAAVYGSDAVGGVVNYILRKDFEGLELDGQTGISSRGDYATYNLRGTYGTNFAGGRGNVAVNVEWSKSPQLRFSARPLSNLARLTVTNPADTGENDGIPSVMEIFDAHFWPFNPNGVVFNIPAPLDFMMTQVNGSAVQFGPDGSLIPYNPGTIHNIPFASGGDGFRYSNLVGLRTGVERLTSNVIGHYEVSDRVTLSTELLYARTKGRSLPQGISRTVLNTTSPVLGAIGFNRDNPFLTQDAIDTLSAASPDFAAGGNLYLSKYFYDLLPSGQHEHTTDVYRGLIGLDGDFDVGSRNFYWSASISHGRVEGKDRLWRAHSTRFNNALSAARDGNGNIVCAINADLDPTNDDAACAPINPFGDGNVSAAAREYVSILTGRDYVNKQTDALFTLGGSLFSLPAGDVQFSAAYEHRDERVNFTPMEPNRLGLFGVGGEELAQSGKYNTDEFSGEVLVPLLGNGVELPGVKSLEFSGAFRYVDNSIAGTEKVWSAGLRWEPMDGVMLRGSRSRNFRAPTLSQLFAPASTEYDSTGYDPCDADRIASGTNPAVRRANCEALFAANPHWGDLADFQSSSENFQHALITTGGNPDLKNEISKTWTYGIVLQPRFIPGLTIVADRIEIDLTDGLSPFTTEDFAAACFDDPNMPEEFCGAFKRLAVGTDGVAAGSIIEGTTTTVNAGIVRYRGEVYTVNYQVPLESIFTNSDPGTLELGLEATRTSLLTTSVTGASFIRSDNTIEQPEWTVRFDARYGYGPFRFTYQMYYMDKVKAKPDATIENNPNPIIGSNMTHSISAQYMLGNMELRAGVSNLFDKQPSYPAIGYGDILGRRFFAGARIRY